MNQTNNTQPPFPSATDPSRFVFDATLQCWFEYDEDGKRRTIILYNGE